MGHRVSVTSRTLNEVVVVECPDDLEIDLRDYLDPPLHLVAWAIVQAGATDPTDFNDTSGYGSEGGRFALAIGMDSITDLPMSVRDVGDGVWTVGDPVELVVTLHGSHDGSLTERQIDSITK